MCSKDERIIPDADSKAFPSGLVQRQPGIADAEQLLLLSDEAGWNQTTADWRLLLTIAQKNALSLWHRNRPIASALAITYGQRFAWICMVLVTSAWRGQGIATQLLQILINRLRKQGFIVGLDATAAGRAVYQPLGFNDIYAIRRLAAIFNNPEFNNPIGSAWHSPVAKAIVIERLSAADLATIAAWDARIFGVKRYTVLKALHERLPQCAFIARSAAGEIKGYVLGRDGALAMQLGPVVAVGDAVAKSLLQAALAAVSKAESLTQPVLIDALAQHHSWLAFLHQLGFVEQRSFSRMLRDVDQALDKPKQLFAVAGPELG